MPGLISASDAAAAAGESGCALLATLMKTPQAAVAANGACDFGTQVAKDTVGSFIDSYFLNKDQDFVDKYCVTIIYSDGKKLEPRDRSKCSAT